MTLVTSSQLQTAFEALGCAVDLSAFRQWLKRHEDMPRPLKPARDSLWPLEEMIAWGRSTERLSKDITKSEAVRVAKKAIEESKAVLDKVSR